MQRKIVPDDVKMESESGKKTKVENEKMGEAKVGGKKHIIKEHSK